MLYKVIAGSEPEIIDSIISEIIDVKGRNSFKSLNPDVSNYGVQDGNGLYYVTIDYLVYDNEKGSYLSKRESYNYYDGNKINILDKSKIGSFSVSGAPHYFGNSLANLKQEVAGILVQTIMKAGESRVYQRMVILYVIIIKTNHFY